LVNQGRFEQAETGRDEKPILKKKEKKLLKGSWGAATSLHKGGSGHDKAEYRREMSSAKDAKG